MKNIEILSLNFTLSNINLKGVKFSYAVAKNLTILKPEVEAITKANEISKDFEAYDNARVEIARKYAKKDEKGEPEVKDGSYVLNGDKENFEKEIAKLQKTHEKAIKEREKQVKDFKELLEKETTIALHKIKLTDIPEDITSQQMSAIYPIIEE